MTSIFQGSTPSEHPSEEPETKRLNWLRPAAKVCVVILALGGIAIMARGFSQTSYGSLNGFKIGLLLFLVLIALFLITLALPRWSKIATEFSWRKKTASEVAPQTGETINTVSAAKKKEAARWQGRALTTAKWAAIVIAAFFLLPYSWTAVGNWATAERHTAARVEMPERCIDLPLSKKWYVITATVEGTEDYCMPPGGVGIEISRTRKDARYQIETPDGIYKMLPEKRDPIPVMDRASFRSLSGEPETIKLRFYLTSTSSLPPQVEDEDESEDEPPPLKDGIPNDKLDEEELADPQEEKLPEVKPKCVPECQFRIDTKARKG